MIKIIDSVLFQQIEWTNGTKEWRVDNKLHRTDGPAVEMANGTKEWWVNGKLHRTDGPAVEWWDGTKHWFVDGERHRIDGPALEFASGIKEWWVNGVQIDIEKIISTHDLNPDWTQWTEDEKILVRLAV